MAPILVVAAATTMLVSLVAAAVRHRRPGRLGRVLLAGWAALTAVAEVARAADAGQVVVLGLLAASSVLAVAGVCVLLSAVDRRPVVVRRLLDAWLISACLLCTAHVLLVGFTPGLEPLVLLATASVDLAVAGAFVRLSADVPSPVDRRRPQAVAAGAALVGAAVFTHYVEAVTDESLLALAAGLSTLAYLVLAVAPWLGSRDLLPVHQAPTALEAALPYVAVGVCSAAVVSRLARGSMLDEATVWLAAAVIAGALARQAFTLADNAALVREAREREAMFRTLVHESTDVILVADLRGSVRYVSPAVLRVYGYRPDDLIGHDVRQLLHPDDADAVVRQLGRFLGSGALDTRVEARVRAADATWRHSEGTVSLLSGGTGAPEDGTVIANLRDVSDRVALQEQLAHLAFHDALTGLPNRALFADRIAHALERQEVDGRDVAVVFLDLDGFKAVNDTSGHAAGDLLLVEAAARLRGTVGPGHTVARFGGDEFAVLLERDVDDASAVALAERLITSLAEPFQVGGRSQSVAASAGVALASEAADADELLRNADLAMYAAKTSGKGRVERYRPALHADAVQRVELTTQLDRALAERGFTLLYQPVVDLTTLRVVAVEALIRWRSEAGALLTPAELVRLAEESGRINSLGRWVVEEALTQAARWRRAGHPVDVAVNLSARQVESPDLEDVVRGALRASGVPPHALTLEVTESVLLEDLDAAADRLAALKSTGVRIALDDFGTGFSSLGYLRRLPVDMLKVDRSFVTGLDGRGRDGAATAGTEAAEADTLASTVVRLGLELGLVVTAEGVETVAQALALQAMGCQRGQGFLFSGPLDAVGVSSVLRRGPLTHSLLTDMRTTVPPVETVEDPA